jgi:hypothetical protein
MTLFTRILVIGNTWNKYNNLIRDLTISSNKLELFENNIDYYVGISIISILFFRFMNSFNAHTRAGAVRQNTGNRQWNINRSTYIYLLLSFISYGQFISILSIFNIEQYPRLSNISNKLSWLNLWNIYNSDLIDSWINNNECQQLNLFFKNHFIFTCSIVIITFINLILIYLFDIIYTPTQTNSLVFNNYIIFPYMELSWINIALSGLIITETSMFNNNCIDFIIISVGLFLIIPIVFLMYYISILKNKILSKENIIYILPDNAGPREGENLPLYNPTLLGIKNKLKYYKSFLDLFNKGKWSLSDNSLTLTSSSELSILQSENLPSRTLNEIEYKFAKSHSLFYIDFEQKKINYLFFNLFKIFFISIYTGLNLTNNLNISFSIISFIYSIDILSILYFKPFKNLLINYINILINLSIIISLLLIIILDKEKYSMYIINSTFFIFDIIIFSELITKTFIELFNNLRR